MVVAAQTEKTHLEDLAELPSEMLEDEVEARERRLRRLFRRWPNLTHDEHSRMRRLYTERLHLARLLGSLRARRSVSSRDQGGTSKTGGDRLG
jgi:hypothetical protein